MMDPYSRTRLLLGDSGMARLKNARVAIFGLGGVGGYVVEALARSGVGTLDLIDHDTVSITNLNRQILATRQTVGQDKVLAAKERIAAIDPEIRVNAHKVFYTGESELDFRAYSYVVDAIDTVTGKLALIQAAQAAGTPIISCMGTGNKLDPSLFQVADLYETDMCPLARILRKECRKRGIAHLQVVYSPEEPILPELSPADKAEIPQGRNTIPGSCSFVPAAAGLVLAGQVIRDIASGKFSQENFK